MPPEPAGSAPLAERDPGPPAPAAEPPAPDQPAEPAHQVPAPAVTPAPGLPAPPPPEFILPWESPPEPAYPAYPAPAFDTSLTDIYAPREEEPLIVRPAD